MEQRNNKVTAEGEDLRPLSKQGSSLSVMRPKMELAAKMAFAGEAATRVERAPRKRIGREMPFMIVVGGDLEMVWWTFGLE
jgi:hypothetical protein